MSKSNSVETEQHFDCIVIGSGPGGYACAFRLADLGKHVAIIEKHKTLGGVCLNVGCIPSKALLHIAGKINQQDKLAPLGINSQTYTLNIEQIKTHKNQTVQTLTQGLQMMAKQRKVTVFNGTASFLSNRSLKITHSDQAQVKTLGFENAVIATGSKPIKLSFLPDSPRIFDSTGALELNYTKGKLLIIGGGIIGCEMATIYQAMGMSVTVVEMQPQIMSGTDTDLVKPFQQALEKKGVIFKTQTQVKSVKATEKKCEVSILTEGKTSQESFDAILSCVGRAPQTDQLNLECTHIQLDEHGMIQVNPETLATAEPHIHAIGDVIGNPMLAHKSTAQGHTVAEIIAGKQVIYDVRAIPGVAYTQPEVAWVGLTETEAKAKGIPYKKGVFPWKASGRALCTQAEQGLSKILSDPNTGIVLGGGIVGEHAGDLIAELTLAIEMGAHIEDIALTVHPHPTFAETIGLAAEVSEGIVTDLPKAKS